MERYWVVSVDMLGGAPPMELCRCLSVDALCAIVDALCRADGVRPITITAFGETRTAEAPQPPPF